MNLDDLLKGLSFIRPNCEWVWRGEDYDGLEWMDNNFSKPTLEEIEAGFIAYQSKLESDKAEAEAKRQAALDKLAALGLEPDDLKALGL